MRYNRGGRADAKVVDYMRAVCCWPGSTSRAREAFCADFVSWVYQKAGVPIGPNETTHSASNSPYTNYKNNGFSSCGGMQQWFAAQNRYTPNDGSYTPQAGDVVFFDYNASNANRATHVAIIERVDGDTIHCVDGNFSGGVKKIARRSTGWKAKNTYYSSKFPLMLGFGKLTGSYGMSGWSTASIWNQPGQNFYYGAPEMVPSMENEMLFFKHGGRALMPSFGKRTTILDKPSGIATETTNGFWSPSTLGGIPTIANWPADAIEVQEWSNEGFITWQCSDPNGSVGLNWVVFVQLRYTGEVIPFNVMTQGFIDIGTVATPGLSANRQSQWTFPKGFGRFVESFIVFESFLVSTGHYPLNVTFAGNVEYVEGVDQNSDFGPARRQ